MDPISGRDRPESQGSSGGGFIAILKVETERLPATGCGHAGETELAIAQGNGHDPSTEGTGRPWKLRGSLPHPQRGRPAVEHGSAGVTAMPRTGEAAFNSLFAEVLRGKHPLWREGLRVEQSGVFPDAPRLRPDLLVQAPGAQPVAVETEFDPAPSVEGDAKARLGRMPAGSADPIEQAIAVRIPESLRRGQADLAGRISAVDFGYCVLAGDPAAPERWPETGWLAGGVDDIARSIEHAMLSERRIREGMSILEQGVRTAAQAVQDAVALGFADIEGDFGRILNQRPGEQTIRMAMTIIANALAFHAAVAGRHGIPTIADLRNASRPPFRFGLLDSWSRILSEINYWPIFKVASDLLVRLRADTAWRVLSALADTAESLARMGVATRHDLSGRMFQNLIVDRKFLATFYTLPASSALLAELAVARLDVDWTDLDAYPDLRVADLSCGTGTLLTAAYHAVLERCRRAGGDDGDIHGAMMERAIVAADIMPAAAHLCASQLSSVHPDKVFSNTRVYTMPYGTGRGVERERGTAIGSLDLAGASRMRSLFATGQRRASGAGGDAEVSDVELPHGSVDLVIMNPPFTRPTNHEAADVPVPSFAGFGTTAEEQRAMSGRLKGIRRELAHPVGNGNAGLASNFVDLAHAKVKPGGVLALVLPMAAVQGGSWRRARELLTDQYEDVAVVSIAASGSRDRAFSADTGMAEALVVATRRAGRTGSAGPALFVNLLRRPAALPEATEVARIAGRLAAHPETGRLDAGGQRLGSYIRAPLSEGGCAGLRESALARTMAALRNGELRMPRYVGRHALPVAPLGLIGERGLLDRDIGNRNDEAPPFRGPFKIVPAGAAPGYPILWGHDADRERRMLVRPDSEGEVRPDCENRAAAAWRTATRLHFNRDFRINSQSLAACLTPDRAIGGRAWPNFRLQDSRWDEAVALWANCTLGLMAFWWAGARQQQGRAVTTVSELPKLMVLDPRGRSEDWVARAGGIFERFRDAELRPANEAYRDDARQALDSAVLVELAGLPEEAMEAFENLRLQWCCEPSVHGGKSTGPAGIA